MGNGKVIAVDLDDTLNDFTEVLQTTDFSFEPGYGLSEWDFARFIELARAGFDEDSKLVSTPFSFFKSRLYLKCYNLANVRPSAALALQRLKRDGWQICICTKRDLRRAFAPTKNWLCANHVPYDYIFAVSDLSQFCKDWKIDMLMERSSMVPTNDEHCALNPNLFEEPAEKSQHRNPSWTLGKETSAKLDLLKEFCSGLPLGSVKVETSEHGWGFLNETLKAGGKLDYGEADGRGAYKYKFRGLSEQTLNQLLVRHVEQTCNVCLYFSEGANACCCINLDVNLRTCDDTLRMEMDLMVRFLTNLFSRLGIAHLIVASGRGYHLWCGFTEPISNEHLFRWMIRSVANAIGEIYPREADRGRIKANFFPDPRVLGMASLRLFGTKHATTGMFSHVIVDGQMLNESDSWKAFQDYTSRRRVSGQRFYESYANIWAKV